MLNLFHNLPHIRHQFEGFVENETFLESVCCLSFFDFISWKGLKVPAACLGETLTH